MLKTYRKIDRGEYILVSVDTAAGMGDYTAAQFLSKTRIDVPMVYHSKVTTSDYIPMLAETLNKIFDNTGVKPTVSLERNNGGAFLIDRLAGINYANKYEVFKNPTYGNINGSESTQYGWSTNTATRPKMLSELKDSVDKRTLGIYDKETIREMFSFILAQTSSSIKAQAEKGAHDDLVMSLAIAWQMYQICNSPISNYDGDDFPEETLLDSNTGLYI